jgi:CAAX protease family protein
VLQARNWSNLWLIRGWLDAVSRDTFHEDADNSVVVGWRDRLRRSKLLIIVELIVAVLFMIGNVVGVIPHSSTPFLLLLGWLSLWLRRSGWRAIGLSRPHFGRTLLLGVVIGTAYQFLSLALIDPLIARLTGRLPDVSQFAPLVGNLQGLLFCLAVVWTLAAFGEELVYRGYLTNRIAELVDAKRARWVVSLLASSALFGAVHYYQGASGVIATGLCGLLYGTLYLVSGHNLWLPIVAHGVLDGVACVLIFLGQYPGL